MSLYSTVRRVQYQYVSRLSLDNRSQRRTTADAARCGQWSVDDADRIVTTTTTRSVGWPLWSVTVVSWLTTVVSHCGQLVDQCGQSLWSVGSPLWSVTVVSWLTTVVSHCGQLVDHYGQSLWSVTVVSWLTTVVSHCVQLADHCGQLAGVPWSRERSIVRCPRHGCVNELEGRCAPITIWTAATKMQEWKIERTSYVENAFLFSFYFPLSQQTYMVIR